jgi:hypothetical protein
MEAHMLAFVTRHSWIYDINRRTPRTAKNPEMREDENRTDRFDTAEGDKAYLAWRKKAGPPASRVVEADSPLNHRRTSNEIRRKIQQEKRDKDLQNENEKAIEALSLKQKTTRRGKNAIEEDSSKKQQGNIPVDGSKGGSKGSLASLKDTAKATPVDSETRKPKRQRGIPSTSGACAQGAYICTYAIKYIDKDINALFRRW